MPFLTFQCYHIISQMFANVRIKSSMLFTPIIPKITNLGRF